MSVITGPNIYLCGLHCVIRPPLKRGCLLCLPVAAGMRSPFLMLFPWAEFYGRRIMRRSFGAQFIMQFFPSDL